MGSVFHFPFRTVAEVSLRHLVKNLVSLRAMSQREVVPVVKADAYGHGLLPVTRVLAGRGGCHTFAVATLEEALEIREKFPSRVSILVLSGFFPHQTAAYVKHRLIPVIHTLHQLRALSDRDEIPELHLKLDTGMHRLGISYEEIPEVLKLLTKLKVKLSGIATHFAESESLTSNFAEKQLAEFEEALKVFRSARLLATDAKIHVGNTAAVLRQRLGPSLAIRPGLGLYGISPNPRIGASDMLTPVLQWKTRVLAVKSVAKGQTVGYGRTYKTKRREKIAILPVGYADGYPRSLSNVGSVLLAGKKLPIRGIVSMDMIAVDATSVTNLREGAEAVLLGSSHKHTISAWDIATWAKTIPYEILCGISARVPRVYLD